MKRSSRLAVSVLVALALPLAVQAAPEAARRQTFGVLHRPGAGVPPAIPEPIPAGPERTAAELRGVRDGAPVNDPFFAKQWWLANEGQADDGGQAGHAGAQPGILGALAQVNTQAPVVLAILDSGLDLTHEDIDPACLWVNPGEDGTDAQGRDRRTNGVDDDGNGYVDDVHGFNFVDRTNVVQEDQWHGTHCGGLVCAATNNSRGIAGAFPPVKIMLVKVFGLGHLLSSEEIAEGVRYAVDNGAKVLSNSYGTPSYVEAFKKVIEYTETRGALFVCAAGNSRKNLDSEEDRDYPSCYGVPNQLVVGSSDNRDASSSFSNYGSFVDLAAPGQAMFGLMPKSKYRAFSGTSMACPIAAGAAALLWSQHPGWTYAQVKQRLIDSADRRPAIARWVRTGARLNVEKAIRGEAGDPLPAYDFASWTERPQVVESRHPYGFNLDETRTVEVPGARRFRVHFRRFDTEAGYDRLAIADGEGRHVETLESNLGETWSAVIEGDRATLKFTSSSVIDGWGWAIDRVQLEPVR